MTDEEKRIAYHRDVGAFAPSASRYSAEALKALSDAATPGPWKYEFHMIVNGKVRMGWLKPPTNSEAGVSFGGERLGEDGEFVAALVNAYRAGDLAVRSERGTSEGGNDTFRLNWLFSRLNDDEIKKKLERVGDAHANGARNGIRMGDFRSSIDHAIYDEQREKDALPGERADS